MSHPTGLEPPAPEAVGALGSSQSVAATRPTIQALPLPLPPASQFPGPLAAGATPDPAPSTQLGAMVGASGGRL